MTSDVNISRRPGLEPIWTPSYHYVNNMPKTIVRPTPMSAGLSPSPISPKTFPSLPSPSPVHPASYDGSMRRQDRALVNSLDQRAVPSLNSAPLTPIEEYSPSPLVARLEKISILPPMSLANSPLAPAPSDVPFRRRSLMSLIDGPASIAGQRQVRNHSYSSMEYLTSPNSPRWDAAVRLRNQLRSWGPVYFGNAKMADAFIIPRSLRQHNCHSPTSPSFAKLPPPAAVAGGALPPPNKRLTVRAIIRPQSQDRPAFLIQRNFDLDELRATIPDPPPHPAAQATNINGVTDGPRSPRSPAELISQQKSGGVSSPPLQQQSRLRRSSTARSGVLLRTDARALDLEGSVRDGKAVPMHLPYARAYLPVVAALLASGHVREGDVVYLPVPHAEAWRATVRYVYTGRGGLTEEVRENILYLAGKV
ncbi:hypothetical protein F4811DRAFT_545342 [Daldinia bambusicola]|nr:hypothetical protein F4811DRAFT_545342 [Daldinia bambusicola]